MKNDMTDVKISVIVPCHNVVGMVGECLESIVNQTIGRNVICNRKLYKLC